MQFSNAMIYCEDGSFHTGGFSVENGLFGELGACKGEDLDGCYAVPGLIDIHFHGALGYSFEKADQAGLAKMAGYLLKNGTTSFALATMAASLSVLYSSMSNAKEFIEQGGDGVSQLLGVYLEGPFLAESRCGGHNKHELCTPDMDIVLQLDEACGGNLKIVCVAPELISALKFIEVASKSFRVSVAHSDADYELAKKAFAAGALQITHTFNAMPPMLHRAPGIIGAAAENSAVFAELICDGLHVHESAVRAVFKLFGAGRVILISDSIAPAGLADGDYQLDGRRVVVCGGRAVLDDGTIAGGTLTLLESLKRAVAFHIPFEDALWSCTATPAKAMGVFGQLGVIKQGAKADFLILDKELELRAVYKDGNRIV